MQLDNRDKELIETWLGVGQDRLRQCIKSYPWSKGVPFWEKDLEDISVLLAKLHGN